MAFFNNLCEHGVKLLPLASKTKHLNVSTIWGFITKITSKTK